MPPNAGITGRTTGERVRYGNTRKGEFKLSQLSQKEKAEILLGYILPPVRGLICENIFVNCRIGMSIIGDHDFIGNIAGALYASSARLHAFRGLSQIAHIRSIQERDSIRMT